MLIKEFCFLSFVSLNRTGVAEGGESQSAAEDEGIERDSPGEPDDHAANSLTGTATVNAASAAAASAAATGNSVMTSLSNGMDVSSTFDFSLFHFFFYFVVL